VPVNTLCASIQTALKPHTILFGYFLQQAVTAGIIDQPKGLFINPETGESVSISTAIGDGRIVIESVKTTRTRETTKSLGLITIKTETDTHEYTILAAIDTASGQKIDINEVGYHLIQ
jgi:hypothetical protein